MLKRGLVIGAVALVAAVVLVPWGTGAPVIIVHPWNVNGTVSLTGPGATPLSISPLVLTATPEDWGGNHDNISEAWITPSGSQPHSWTMTLDGGDPADPANEGRDYQFAFTAWLTGGFPQNTWVKVVRNAPLLVKSGVPVPSLDFAVTVPRRLSGTVTVANGTLESFSLWSSKEINGESVSSWSHESMLNTTTRTLQVLTPVAADVQVWGSGSVIDATGARRWFTLAMGTRDLSAGDASISWSVDALPTSGFMGSVAVALGSFASISVSHEIFLIGQGPTTARATRSR